MKKSSNQKFPFLGIVIFVLAMAFITSDELPVSAGPVVVVAFVAIAVIAMVAIVLSTVTKHSRSDVHTHDRIDHSTDLKIDKATGKTTSITKPNIQHTPREHWQQQLNALLANGTIDRKEYQAMMRRKF